MLTCKENAVWYLLPTEKLILLLKTDSLDFHLYTSLESAIHADKGNGATVMSFNKNNLKVLRLFQDGFLHG